jgi:hypothetical protein
VTFCIIAIITVPRDPHSGPRTTQHLRPAKGNPRRNVVLATARDAGLLAGASGRIAARIRQPLIDAAKARSGINSDAELLEYALARVALEDDFWREAERPRRPRAAGHRS